MKKVLFLDIDGVLNDTGSTMAKIGFQTRTSAQDLAIQGLMHKFEVEDELPYGPTFTIQTINPVAVGLVNRMLAKDLDLHIVLSTSHRSMFSGSNYKINGREIAYGSDEHFEVLRAYMRALGLVAPPDRLVAGITPRLYIERGKEVRQFLDEHPEIERHCAVDDGGDFKPSDCNFVRTDPKVGLTGEKYFEIVKHLAIHESDIIF